MTSPPKSDATDEPRLVLLALSGDDGAFQLLVRLRHAWLRSLLRRVTGEATLADDLSQETFLKAWQRIDTLQDHRLFGPWLRRIAIRVWLDHCRRRKIELESCDFGDTASPPGAGGVETADERMDLESALSSLRPAPRLCVILFYAEGMSHSEVAAATGLTIGMVKTHIARSTQRLRQSLWSWT